MQLAALQNTHAAKWLEPPYMLHAATAKRVIFDLYRFIYLYTVDIPKPFAEKSQAFTCRTFKFILRSNASPDREHAGSPHTPQQAPHAAHLCVVK